MMERVHEAVRSEFTARRLQRADEAEERLSWSLAQRQAFTDDRLGAFLEPGRAV